MMGTLLISAMIAIGFVMIANCSNLALAQYSTNTPSTPPSGEPSTSSGPRVPPAPQSQIHQRPTEANPASTGNNTTVAGNNATAVGNNATAAGNGTTIGPPAITIVGPSSFTASPITNENQVNVNTTSTQGNESSLGVPAQ
jgi:hypothetical protein